ESLDRPVLANDGTNARNEDRIAEGHDLLALQRVGGRTADDVDRPVLNERNLRAELDRLEPGLNRRKLQLFLDRIDDPAAEVHREADRLLIVVEIGKRHRNIAV